MDLGLSGRTAWVTGASKGIGRATAETLAREGCSVVLIARASPGLDEAAGQIRNATGSTASVFAADLSRADDIARLWADVPAPDILVNNAGAIPSGSIADVDETRWREAWDLKVFGYISMCREALARMSQRGSGVIINVIGAGGERPRADYAAGAGGNAALMALTRALGSTSALNGVRVVGINPGQIETTRMETQMRRRAASQLGDADRWRELLDPRYPPGQPRHIADLAAFLASDLSSNTTGTIITCDGGSSAR